MNHLLSRIETGAYLAYIYMNTWELEAGRLKTTSSVNGECVLMMVLSWWINFLWAISTHTICERTTNYSNVIWDNCIKLENCFILCQTLFAYLILCLSGQNKTRPQNVSPPPMRYSYELLSLITIRFLTPTLSRYLP